MVACACNNCSRDKNSAESDDESLQSEEEEKEDDDDDDDDGADCDHGSDTIGKRKLRQGGEVRGEDRKRPKDLSSAPGVRGGSHGAPDASIRIESGWSAGAVQQLSDPTVLVAGGGRCMADEDTALDYTSMRVGDHMHSY